MADAAALDRDTIDDGSAPPKKRLAALLSRRNIIIAAALVVLSAAGGAAYVLGFVGGGDAAPVKAAPKPAVFMEVPDLTVNLNSADRRSQYLKIRISLEVEDEAMAARIRPYLPRVLDAFQVYLREVRSSDLEGSAGMFRLKEELQRRINLAIAPARVNGVLFREILIQ